MSARILSSTRFQIMRTANHFSFLGLSNAAKSQSPSSPHQGFAFHLAGVVYAANRLQNIFIFYTNLRLSRVSSCRTWRHFVLLNPARTQEVHRLLLTQRRGVSTSAALRRQRICAHSCDSGMGHSRDPHCVPLGVQTVCTLTYLCFR